MSLAMMETYTYKVSYEDFKFDVVAHSAWHAVDRAYWKIQEYIPKPNRLKIEVKRYENEKN
jgi:hypothetical protein